MGSENASIEYESYATLVDFVALADSGDHRKFQSNAEFWSAQEGQAPVVRPNGLIVGGFITPGAANDKVDVAGAKVYQDGELVDVVAASALAVTRASTDTHCVTSIVVNASGVYAAIAGEEGTAFSEERGADGGPPWIPTGAIEIGQVRLASKTGALVTADEIKQGVNVHVERYDFPVWEVKYMEAENGILSNAGVKFAAAMPTIHSDDAGVTVATKKVWAKYYEPEFVQVSKATGFGASERSYSTSSTPYYAGVTTSVTSSMGQGQFTAYLNDGVSDAFLKVKDKTIMVKFLPDRNNPTVYRVEIGKLGIKRSWPASGEVAAACTLSPIMEGVEVYG